MSGWSHRARGKEMLTKKTATRCCFPRERSFSSCCNVCLSKSTAMRVFPEPEMCQLLLKSFGFNFSPCVHEAVMVYNSVPVSRTAIIFRFLARSKSSIWYARGFRLSGPTSFFAASLAIVSSSSEELEVSDVALAFFVWFAMSSFALLVSLGKGQHLAEMKCLYTSTW